MKAKILFKEAFQHKETNCTVIADDGRVDKTAISSIEHHGKKLEGYIRNHPRFLYSLQPVPVNDGSLVVKLMADAAEKANVGSMAAVAGVLADLAVKDMTLEGSEVFVIENGGGFRHL